LKTAKEKYSQDGITKEDIFFYVYGFLHSPEYRETFSVDLKKSLPKLPLVEGFEEFRAFSKAGRALANLHLNYEKVTPLETVTVTIKHPENPNYIVEKMRYKSKDDRSLIRYNDEITIENIPENAQKYVVNGRSAVDWILERYQVKIDKDSQIKNDPNLWCSEQLQPRYILDLLLSVIAVSVKSVEIIEGLPKITFGEENV
jgi:predicted helicase